MNKLGGKLKFLYLISKICCWKHWNTCNCNLKHSCLPRPWCPQPWSADCNWTSCSCDWTLPCQTSPFSYGSLWLFVLMVGWEPAASAEDFPGESLAVLQPCQLAQHQLNLPLQTQSWVRALERLECCLLYTTVVCSVKALVKCGSFLWYPLPSQPMIEYHLNTIDFFLSLTRSTNERVTFLNLKTNMTETSVSIDDFRKYYLYSEYWSDTNIKMPLIK